MSFIPSSFRGCQHESLRGATPRANIILFFIQRCLFSITVFVEAELNVREIYKCDGIVLPVVVHLHNIIARVQTTDISKLA
jgi:hypothetical protein